LLCQGLHGELTGLVATLFERNQIRKSHPAMFASAMEGKLTIFQQLDQVRPRDIQYIRRLLGGQLCMNWHHLHGIAIEQLGQDIKQPGAFATSVNTPMPQALRALFCGMKCLVRTAP